MSDEPRCASKRLFQNEKTARMAARRLRKQAIDIWRLQAYRCEIHGGWHIGNTPIHFHSVTRDSPSLSGRL